LIKANGLHLRRKMRWVTGFASVLFSTASKKFPKIPKRINALAQSAEKVDQNGFNIASGEFNGWRTVERREVYVGEGIPVPQRDAMTACGEHQQLEKLKQKPLLSVRSDQIRVLDVDWPRPALGKNMMRTEAEEVRGVVLCISR